MQQIVAVMKPLIACATVRFFVKLMQGKEKSTPSKGIPHTEATHKKILDVLMGAFADYRSRSCPNWIEYE